MRRRLAEGTRIETAPLRDKDFPLIMGLGYCARADTLSSLDNEIKLEAFAISLVIIWRFANSLASKCGRFGPDLRSKHHQDREIVDGQALRTAVCSDHSDHRPDYRPGHSMFPARRRSASLRRLQTRVW